MKFLFFFYLLNFIVKLRFTKNKPLNSITIELFSLIHCIIIFFIIVTVYVQLGIGSKIYSFIETARCNNNSGNYRLEEEIKKTHS